MILIIFLLSIGVLEWILWRDKKVDNRRQPPPLEPSAQGQQTAADLMALMTAVKPLGTAAVDTQEIDPKAAPEYNKTDVQTG